MNDLPILFYKETEPQVVPDLNNPESLETSVPIVSWGGKRVHIKEIWSEYQKIGATHENVQKRTISLRLIQIISQIQKTHPDYFISCLRK